MAKVSLTEQANYKGNYEAVLEYLALGESARIESCRGEVYDCERCMEQSAATFEILVPRQGNLTFLCDACVSESPDLFCLAMLSSM